MWFFVLLVIARVYCQAFKFASGFVEFKKEFFRDPRVYGDGTLLTKSLGKAWLLTVLFQGVVFGLIQGVFLGENILA